VVDASGQQGLMVGMELKHVGDTYGTATVVGLNVNSALVSYGPPYPEAERPAVGWEMTTGPDVPGGLSRFDHPWDAQIKLLTRRHYARVSGFVSGWPHITDLPKARRYGFEVKTIASITVRAVDPAIMDTTEVWDKTRELVDGAGGTVYDDISPKRKNRKDRPLFKKTIVVYRVERNGEPVTDLLDTKALGFDVDWERTYLQWRVDHNGFLRAVNNERDILAAASLQLSKAQWDRFTDIRFETLRPDQRQALEEKFGLRHASGTWNEAWKSLDEERRKRWSKELDITLRPHVQEIKKRYPREYAEYQDLEKRLALPYKPDY
jgi:hypothetical protein